MANVVTDVGGKLVEGIFSGVLWIGIAFLVMSVLGFIMYWFLIYKRKFNINVKIISDRADDRNAIIFDKAAILRDRKTKSSYIKLWTLKIELPAPQFTVLQNAGKFDYLELYRTADNKIVFLTPSIIDKQKIINQGGKEVLIARQQQKQIDSDMEFWAAKRKSDNHKMFDLDKLWMKILPFLPHILGGMITIFVLYILMSYLPQVLSELNDLAITLKGQAKAIATTG